MAYRESNDHVIKMQECLLSLGVFFKLFVCLFGSLAFPDAGCDFSKVAGPIFMKMSTDVQHLSQMLP